METKSSNISQDSSKFSASEEVKAVLAEKRVEGSVIAQKGMLGVPDRVVQIRVKIRPQNAK